MVRRTSPGSREGQRCAAHQALSKAGPEWPPGDLPLPHGAAPHTAPTLPSHRSLWRGQGLASATQGTGDIFLVPDFLALRLQTHQRMPACFCHLKSMLNLVRVTRLSWDSMPAHTARAVMLPSLY